MQRSLILLPLVLLAACKTTPKGYETSLSQSYPEAEMRRDGGQLVLNRKYLAISRAIKPESLRIYDAGVMGILPQIQIQKTEGLQCDFKEGAIEDSSSRWVFKPRSEKASALCFAKNSTEILEFSVDYFFARTELRWSEINNDEREVLVRIGEDLDKKLWSPGMLAWLDLFGIIDEQQVFESFEFKSGDSKTIAEFYEDDYFEAIELRTTEGVQCEARFSSGNENLDRVRQTRISYVGRKGKIVCSSSGPGSGWLRYLFLSNSRLSSWANSLSKNDEKIRETLQNRNDRKRWYGLYRSTQYVQVESAQSKELHRLGALSVLKAEHRHQLTKAGKMKADELKKIKFDQAAESERLKTKIGDDPDSDYFPMLSQVNGYPFLVSFQVKPTSWIWKGPEGESSFQDIRFKEQGFDSEVTKKSSPVRRFKSWLYSFGLQGQRFMEDSILLSSLQKTDPRGAFKERVLRMCAKQAKGARQFLAGFISGWDKSVRNSAVLDNVRTESPYMWMDTLKELQDNSNECGLDFGFASHLYLKRTARYHFCYQSVVYRKKGEKKDRLAWKPSRIEVDYVPLRGEAVWEEKKSIASSSGHSFFKSKRVETDRKFQKLEKCVDAASLFPEIPVTGFPALRR